MAKKKIDKLVEQVENFLGCWKQLNHFINLARAKKFKPEDEDQFLELKSIIIQELEFILASIQSGTPSREEVHTLIAGVPSLRFLSEMQEGNQRAIEGQWHKIYVGWLAVLGQLKVQQQEEQSKSFLTALAGEKSK